MSDFLFSDSFINGAVSFGLGILFGYGIAKRPQSPLKNLRTRRRSVTGTPRCQECGAFHEYLGECPIVRGGAGRIQ